MVFLVLLLLVPLSLCLAYATSAPPLWVFLTAVLAIVPLAEWMRRATEQLALLAGPAIGGLLNVTFGNAAELILALFVLIEGHSNVVKGQITGSIIGNGLLGLGLAILVGSWGRSHQNFQRNRAGLLSSLLVLVLVALLVPALFDYTERGLSAERNIRPLDESLSLGVSVVLLLVYVANLVYTLVTHRDVFALEGSNETPQWGLGRSLAVLLAATVATAWEADLISKALDDTAGQIGVTPFFLGAIVLAIIGNAAEYVSAAYFAHRGRLSLAMSITLGSTIQVALVVAPVLVIVSRLIGHPMDLVFSNPLELVAIGAVALVVNSISSDGEATWFEGVLLIAVYAILALAFFHMTA